MANVVNHQRQYNNNNNNHAQKDRSANQTNHHEAVVLEPSVYKGRGWVKLDHRTINLAALTRLSLSVPEPKDLVFCGSKTLNKVDSSFVDPILMRLAADNKATVFATDEILSTLMCALKSAYCWDLVVRKEGNKLFFDKRPEGRHETTSQKPLSNDKRDINWASEGYRYRRWNLGDGVSLVSRCELQSVLDVNGSRQYLTYNALNDIDPSYTGFDWRPKPDTQRGAVKPAIANELRAVIAKESLSNNNANKFAKWTTQALLAGADTMKVGLVSRIHPTGPTKHEILGVVGYKPKDFASQINLNMPNKWGVLKRIIDLCMKFIDGKYVLVKHPTCPQIMIYKVPKNTFEPAAVTQGRGASN